MNISLQKVNGVSAVLTVNLVKDDYQAQVDKSLKTLRQKIDLPGFRRGMVPMSIVKRRFGTSVKVEEIEKLLQKGVSEYIKENNVDMLGTPLPKPSTQDMAADEDLQFDYDIALAPQFDPTLTADDTVDYYDIAVTDEMVDSQISMYTQQQRTYEQVQEYADGDMLKGTLTELDAEGAPLDGGIVVADAVMMPAYLKNEEQKAAFTGATLGGTVTFCPAQAYGDNDAAAAALLKIEKDQVAQHSGLFSYAIADVTRPVPAPLDQELFDAVLGKDAVKSEEEFRAKIRENITSQYVADSDFKFLLDLRAYITEKIGKQEFDETLMKRIMKQNAPDKDDAFIDENYEKSLQELTWHLIKEKLAKAYDVKIDDKDITDMAKAATRAQFAEYGMTNVPDSLLDNYAKEMLKKEETVNSLIGRAIDSKITAAAKGRVTLRRKEVTFEEFNKFFQ